MRKEIKAEKKLTILAIIVITSAFFICLWWDIFCRTPYYGYSQGAEMNFSASLKMNYEKKVDEFTYKVYPPGFLHNNGFISLNWGTFTVQTDSDGKIIPSGTPDISLYIWPSVFKEPTYGLMVDNDEISEQSTIEYIKNDDGSYTITHEFETKEGIMLFNEYEGTIEDMIDCAEATWDFNGFSDIIYGFKMQNE